MATKPKAILSTHDGREASPITKASNVLFENGQTAQDILNDRQDAMISPAIENSSSMFKVGQGDNVDYSANVVNGAYEGMVLKGKTMVNCIQESSSQDVVLPYAFEDGQYVTINDTKESGALGVELKGQTLVNIHGKKTPSLAAAENDWYSNLVIETNSISFTVAKLPENWRYINFKSLNLSMLKPNTKYLVAFEEASGVSTVTFKNGDSTHPLSDTVQIVSNKAIVTTTSDWVNSAQILYIYVPARNVGAEVKVKNPMVIEYQEGMENWDIPYFEGMTSCKMPILTTTGKNLVNKENFVTGIFHSFNLEVLPDNTGLAIDKNNAIKVEPNTTYILSCVTGYKCGVLGLNETKTSITINTGWKNTPNGYTFTTDANTHYVIFNIGKTDNSIIQLSDKDTLKLMLEKGTVATTYEPHKSSILSLPEEVVLRSLPSGVCDTFNTRTGIYTQRIGEYVLDGSQSVTKFEKLDELSCCNSRFTVSGFATTNNRLNIDIYCDKFSTGDVSEEGIRETVKTYNQLAYVEIRLSILKSKLSSIDESGVVQYLQTNPTTIQYELATPIITKINLPSTLKSWNATTHIYSEIPENTLYPILSHSNPSYPVILKPSTKYSIVANSYSNDHTNSTINFNLGGATASTTVGNRVTTITTPSTLTSEELVMSGRGNKLNNVMVIEGDVVGDEPYFEGICDCKSPILSNVGENLFDKNTVIQGYYNGSDIFYNDSKFITYENPISVIPDTEYIFSNNIQTKYGRVNFYDKNMKILSAITDLNLSPFTTPSGCYFIRISTYRNTGITPSDIEWSQLETGRIATSYEPYKSNILSCNGDKIELTEDMFEQGAFAYRLDVAGFDRDYCVSNSDSSLSNKRVRAKKLFKIKPSTTYRILIGSVNYTVGVQGFDTNGLTIRFDTGWKTDYVFTTPANMEYCNILMRKTDDSTITPSSFSDMKLQLSEIDKTIVLRSLPNGTCDTLNVETGEYVQRIGEVMLDGSEDWQLSSTPTDTTLIRFSTRNKPHNVITGVEEKSTSHYLTDRFGIHEHGSYTWHKLECAWTHFDSGLINIVIKKDKLVSDDVTGFKQWLSQNPTTVQYQFQDPIVKTVDLSGYPFSYENGHVVLSSGSIEQSLTPKVEYSLPTNRNGQIRSNQKMVEKHQKELDRLQAIILANLINSQYQQTLTTLKYELSRV